MAAAVVLAAAGVISTPAIAMLAAYVENLEVITSAFPRSKSLRPPRKKPPRKKLSPPRWGLAHSRRSCVRPSSTPTARQRKRRQPSSGDRLLRLSVRNRRERPPLLGVGDCFES